MKNAFLPLFLLITCTVMAQEDYTIYINGKAMPASLDKKYEVVINGQKVNLEIKANDTLTYSDDFLSFKYTKDYKITKTSIDQDIEQIMVMTADGTGVVFQKYSTISPATLNEMMIAEVTKESVSYGYALKREDYQKKLRSGTMLKVDRAVLKYKDETNIYEVATLGKKDSGVLIMTMKMDDNKESKGQQLIDLMWKTLVIK